MRIFHLALGTWNLCTLLDVADTDKLLRRTILTGSELAIYNINIAVLSEIQLAAEGELHERGTGFTLF